MKKGLDLVYGEERSSDYVGYFYSFDKNFKYSYCLGEDGTTIAPCGGADAGLESANDDANAKSK